ncbi:MAG: DUF4145 domain-containing protein [Betaproteobacteria bacterium]|nr:DUF4145 domain-containing protein [Betaproteobacteria bacterium]
MTDVAEKKKAHCNTCGGERTHLLLNKIMKSGEELVGDQYPISWGDTYYVLECGGCESVRLLQESWFSEDTDFEGHINIHQTYYPSSIFRPLPRWFTSLDTEWHITKLVKETYQALQNDAPSLAAMGVRAIIEAIMIDKVGDSGTFKGNLKAFQAKGYISSFQLENLEAALELGHASIHRGFIPKNHQIEVALDILENLVQGLYLLENKAKATVEALPKREV